MAPFPAVRYLAQCELVNDVPAFDAPSCEQVALPRPRQMVTRALRDQGGKEWAKMLGLGCGGTKLGQRVGDRYLLMRRV